MTATTATATTATPETTPVFIHIFARVTDASDEMSAGGNATVLAASVEATIHRTLKEACAFRMKTGGYVIPTTADKLSELFPPGCILAPHLPFVTLTTPKDSRKDLEGSLQQTTHIVEVIAPHVATDHSAQAISRKDNDWLEQIHKVIHISL